MEKDFNSNDTRISDLERQVAILKAQVDFLMKQTSNNACKTFVRDYTSTDATICVLCGKRIYEH